MMIHPGQQEDRQRVIARLEDDEQLSASGGWHMRRASLGQLRGGGASKILPLNSGGGCVQNQFSSRAVESALPFAMALSFKEGPLFAGQGGPRVATTLALFSRGRLP